MGAESSDANPSRAAGTPTFPCAAEESSPSRAQTRTVSNAHAAAATHPHCRRGTPGDVHATHTATGQTLGSALPPSPTLLPHAREMGAAPGPRPFSQGPQTLRSPPHSQRHPQAAGVRASPGRQPRISGPAPAPPSAAGRAPSHLAAAAADSWAPGSARLHWRRSPRSRRRRRVLRGGSPGDGGGPASVRQLLQPLAGRGRATQANRGARAGHPPWGSGRGPARG